jgi:outer membrane murein-binding lipoprotein Lpp
MPVEGLRAWIGEVERKLAVRTRIFLVLAALALGVSGAGIYLAVEAHNDTVSEGDVQALQEQLEGRIDQVSSEAAAGGGASVTTLEQEVSALRAQVKALQKGGAGGEAGGGEHE